jgi:Right handed beta helix region
MYPYRPSRRHTGVWICAVLLLVAVRDVATSAQLPSAPRAVRFFATGSMPTIAVSPHTAQLAPGNVLRFTAAASGMTSAITWTATGGTIGSDGSYTAGPLSGTYLVTASIPGAVSKSATVTIAGPPVVAIAPGQNIQSVINSHPAGTTFLLKAGVHRRQTITPRTGDIFVGETSGDTRLTILSGAGVLTGWAFDGARWYVSGQTQGSTPVVSAAEACRATHPRCIFAEDLFFDNVMKYHEDVLAEVGPGEWFFDYASDRIYVGDNPAGHVVETSITPTLFNRNSADNVTIQNVIVEKYASPVATGAVNLGDSANGAENWMMRDSEVRWNHGAGIGNDANSIARNNYVHHNCGFGFVGAGVNVVVEGNEIAYNNVMAGSTATCGSESFWGAGGSKWVWTWSLIVRGNFSHHNDGPGLWTDINNIYSLYENNIIEDNVRGGIFHEISYDAVIRNNTIRRNGTGKDYPGWTTGAGIEIVSSRNVEVYGNTLIDNWQGITGLEDHRGSGNNGAWTLINLNVHGNNVTSRINEAGGGRSGILDTIGTQAACLPAANNRFQGNTYTLGSNANYFIWMGVDRNEGGWQAYGQDTSGRFSR